MEEYENKTFKILLILLASCSTKISALNTVIQKSTKLSIFESALVNTSVFWQHKSLQALKSNKPKFVSLQLKPILFF